AIRGLAAKVDIDHAEVGLDRASVINCDAFPVPSEWSATKSCEGFAQQSATPSGADLQQVGRVTGRWLVWSDGS
ncbi:MAG: hypothetical protein ACYDEN_14675, partial [Acidimicrobiales bacterium]